MDLYIATGVSYLFTVICLKVNENRDAPGDLIIVDAFPHVADYAKRLDEIGLFQTISVVPKGTFEGWSRLSKEPRTRAGRYFAFVKELLLRRHPGLGLERYRGYPFAHCSYTRLYASGVTNAFLWLQLWLRQRYHCQLFLYDSGIGTRILRTRQPPTLWDQTLRRLGGAFGEDYIQGRYYFEQTGTDASYGKPLRQTLPSTQNEKLVDVVTRCFDYKPQEDRLFAHDYVFLQQCFDAHMRLRPLAPRQEALWRHIAGAIPDAVICPHPRTREQYDPARTVSSGTGFASYDVSCMFCGQMAEKVLITCFSYSPLVPRHMFGQEPYVLYLYRLLGIEEISGLSMAGWDDLLHRAVKACYRDPSKVMIPASERELDECLRIIAARKAVVRRGEE